MENAEKRNRKIEYTAREWIVPGLFPTGLTLLAGAAKCGKSWFALGLAASVSLGLSVLGKIEVKKAGVLYLALEDIDRRLQERLSTIIQGNQAPDNLHLFFEWPKFDQGGLEKLDVWLSAHSDVRLVIVDVYAKVKKPNRGKNWYEEDYEALGNLKRLADKHSITLILIVHLSKRRDDEDPLNAITGSTGMSGAPDTLALLSSNRQMMSGKLTIVGRDVQQMELALKFDKESTSWIIDGDSEEYKISDQRTAILDLLRKHKQPMKSGEIAKALNKNDNAIRQLLHKLLRDGDVKKPSYGYYTIPDNNNNIDNNDNANNNDNNESLLLSCEQ